MFGGVFGHSLGGEVSDWKQRGEGRRKWVLLQAWAARQEEVFQQGRKERGLTTADLLGPGGNVKCAPILMTGVKCRKGPGQVKLKFQSH